MVSSFSLFVVCLFFARLGVLALPGDACRTNTIDDPHKCFVNMNCDGMSASSLYASSLFNLLKDSGVDLNSVFADPVAGDDSWSGNKVCDREGTR